MLRCSCPFVLLALLCAGSTAGAVTAPLQGRLPATPGGTDYQAWYDPDLDVTWLADVLAAAGSAFDDGASATDGKLTWDSGVAWAASLSINGVSGWRLPNMDVDGDGGIVNCGGDGTPGCADNHYGYLYWEEGIVPASPAPFTFIPTSPFWSRTETSAVSAAVFNFNNGFQGDAGKSAERLVWALLDGDASPVPVPAAAWMFGSGAALLAWRLPCRRVPAPA